MLYQKKKYLHLLIATLTILSPNFYLRTEAENLKQKYSDQGSCSVYNADYFGATQYNDESSYCVINNRLYELKDRADNTSIFIGEIGKTIYQRATGECFSLPSMGIHHCDDINWIKLYEFSNGGIVEYRCEGVYECIGEVKKQLYAK